MGIMHKIKQKLLLALMQSRVYKWMLINIIPYIRFTTYYTSLRGWQYQRGYKLLKSGDIILAVDRWKLTSHLIPGTFTHAALCVAKGEEWEVSEMTHENYRQSTFFDICKESDRVVILRCSDWDTEYVQKVIDKCKSFINAQYDVDFDLNGVTALYCSELVYQSDFERRLKVDLSDLAGIGRPYISPDDIWEARNRTLIWDSAFPNYILLTPPYLVNKGKSL